MRVGSKVKLNPYVHYFVHNQGPVEYGEIGTIREVNGDALRIDFPSMNYWHGYTNEVLEIREEYKKCIVEIVGD